MHYEEGNDMFLVLTRNTEQAMCLYKMEVCISPFCPFSPVQTHYPGSRGHTEDSSETEGSCGRDGRRPPFLSHPGPEPPPSRQYPSSFPVQLRTVPCPYASAPSIRRYCVAAQMPAARRIASGEVLLCVLHFCCKRYHMSEPLADPKVSHWPEESAILERNF
jgi:hypothetical protein